MFGITKHQLMKVKETKVELERKDDYIVLLVWFCFYCYDSERSERCNIPYNCFE